MTFSTEEEWLASLPDDVQAFVRKLVVLPDLPLALAKYAQAMVTAKHDHKTVAGNIAERARALAPRDARVWEATEWHYKQRVRRWHFSLLHDHQRNAAYREALNQSVQPGMTVLEIGAGSGIIAMFAAQAGAKHVYSCEMEPLVAAAARENVRRNGLSDKITIIEKKSTELEIGPDLLERPDILVSEIVDNVVLGEEILPTMEDAWARLLKENTIVLPSRVESRGALVGGMPWTRHLRAPECFGLDLSAMNLLAPCAATLSNPEIVTLDEAISGDFSVIQFDFSKPRSHAPGEQVLKVEARKDGVVDGVLTWLHLDFGDGVTFSNRPPCESAWHPQVHVFPEPRVVKKGDVLEVSVSHDRKRVMVRPG